MNADSKEENHYYFYGSVEYKYTDINKYARRGQRTACENA